VDEPDANPLAVDEGVAAGLRRMGVSDEAIQALVQEEPAGAQRDDFEVYADCWDSVLFFLKVQTQWIYRGVDGHRAGLNATAVQATMQMAGVKRAHQAGLLGDLQVMELEVLATDMQTRQAAQTSG
jgi:hypothetical protein